MTTPKPFNISVPDSSSLDLLQRKLALTTLPDELDDAGWDYGAPLADIKRLVDRWQNGYSGESRSRRSMPPSHNTQRPSMSKASAAWRSTLSQEELLSKRHTAPLRARLARQLPRGREDPASAHSQQRRRTDL
ncbi:hypothetical protein MRB53_041569 [Persea americana]|nr:hypothetical protein MRB53_041569 [Persea americana]